jgi:predicted LPLAT superfamily acyltransferase
MSFPPTQGWSQIGERGSMLGLRAVLAFYRLAGRPLSLVLVHAIVLYYFLTLPRARRASRAYLRRIASRPRGAIGLGRRPGVLASFFHFRAFSLSIFDRIELWFGREDRFRFEVFGREHYDRLLTPECGGIIVGSHLGSFDALRELSRQDGRVVNVVMFTRNAPRINAFFEQLSPNAKMRLIHADSYAPDTVLQIRACVARGEIVAMLGDRMEPGDRGRSCRVPFLGDPVAFPTAPYWLAGLLECPLFFMVALRAEGGLYRVFAEVLSEKVQLDGAAREESIRKLAVSYADKLERYCDAAPYQWFNFFDFWHEEN